MHPHWIGLVAFLAILMCIIASVPTGESLAVDSTVTGPVQTLMQYTEVWSELNWVKLINPITHVRFFYDLFKSLIAEETLYAIFPEDSPWLIIWWVLMAPIIATVVFGVVMVFLIIFQRQV